MGGSDVSQRANYKQNNIDGQATATINNSRSCYAPTQDKLQVRRDSSPASVNAGMWMHRCVDTA